MTVKPRPWDFLLSPAQRQALAALMVLEAQERRKWGDDIIDLRYGAPDHEAIMKGVFKHLARIIRKEKTLVEVGVGEARRPHWDRRVDGPLIFVYRLIIERITFSVNEWDDGSTYVLFGSSVSKSLHCTALVGLLKALSRSSPEFSKFEEMLEVAHRPLTCSLCGIK